MNCNSHKVHCRPHIPINHKDSLQSVWHLAPTWETLAVLDPYTLLSFKCLQLPKTLWAALGGPVFIDYDHSEKSREVLLKPCIVSSSMAFDISKSSTTKQNDWGFGGISGKPIFDGKDVVDEIPPEPLAFLRKLKDFLAIGNR